MFGYRLGLGFAQLCGTLMERSVFNNYEKLCIYVVYRIEKEIHPRGYSKS